MTRERKVFCSRYQQELPGLDRAPFPGELGQEIFDRVSARAWSEWQDGMMIKVINEYRLNLAEANEYELLLQQMRAFLNLDTQTQPLEVENAERGRGKS